MMKIRDGFIRKTIAGSEIVLAVGEAAERFNGTITLNETGKLLWETLEAGCDMDTLVQKLLDAYEVEEAVARADVERFVANLKQYGIIYDPDAPDEQAGLEGTAKTESGKPKRRLFGRKNRS